MRSTALTALAAMFAAVGVGALVTTLVSLGTGVTFIDLGFINLFIGLGLIRRSARARNYAILLAWASLLFTAAAFILRVVRPGLFTHFSIAGVSAGSIPIAHLLGMTVTGVLITVLQIWLLGCKEVRAAFDSPEREGA